ncbi:hypothetical protein [Pseudomonas huanghezhanensis]|uniref:hypothetical protein n=1 Tax=Pseudomonas huanghezhanensis TaxID=3002903 RepID=UPI0022862EB9|nr:hypothetical protein [Pseudomonas sp. BSw22131]
MEGSSQNKKEKAWMVGPVTMDIACACNTNTMLQLLEKSGAQENREEPEAIRPRHSLPRSGQQTAEKVSGSLQRRDIRQTIP